MRIPSDQSYQDRNRKGKLPTQQPQIPIVLRDKSGADYKLSAEAEEELEWQRRRGSCFFKELVELIKGEADKRIRDEDEDEDRDKDDDENDDEDHDGPLAAYSRN